MFSNKPFEVCNKKFYGHDGRVYVCGFVMHTPDFVPHVHIDRVTGVKEGRQKGLKG